MIKYQSHTDIEKLIRYALSDMLEVEDGYELGELIERVYVSAYNSGLNDGLEDTDKDDLK